MTINEMVKEAHENSKSHGFWDDASEPGWMAGGEKVIDFPGACETIPEKLMLIVTEVAEAMEEYRAKANEELTVSRLGGLHLEKPEGFPSELADIIIRVADLAGALGIDLEKAVAEKMAYNATRPYRHGGKRA